MSTSTAADADQDARYGQISVFTSTTPPSPEGLSVTDDRVFSSGPADMGFAGKGPSQLFVYSRETAELIEQIALEGEELEYEHAFGGSALDADDRLYVVTSAPRAPYSARLGVQRFTRDGDSYVQDQYSDPFPNLPGGPFGEPVGEDGSPLSVTLPNHIVFAPDGSAYVSDSIQGAIWRIPPGGGAPEVWVQAPVLLGDQSFPIGANGLRFNPERTHLYVASSARPAIYRIKFVASPTEADVELFHEYPQGSGETGEHGFDPTIFHPDGMAFGSSGNLYVGSGGVPGPSTGISVLDPSGAEAAKIASGPDDPAQIGGVGDVVFDDPSRSLLISSHSGNAILRVFVDDTADPLSKPDIPG